MEKLNRAFLLIIFITIVISGAYGLLSKPRYSPTPGEPTVLHKSPAYTPPKLITPTAPATVKTQTPSPTSTEEPSLNPLKIKTTTTSKPVEDVPVQPKKDYTLVIVVAIAVILALAVGGYYFYHRQAADF